MKRSIAWLFFVAAAGSLAAGLAPLLRDRPINVVFLASAVVWLVMGVAAKRGASRDERGGGGHSS
ncbi:MAG TPA: hypothetical protein VFP58_07940 [Candidatus Eisenbacteria bacterium]|nr:hypothetical protein [Candidatus Eisenbacteria bacterium]